MGLFDKIFDEVQRGVDKFSIEDSSRKQSKRGQFGGSDWLNAFTGGSFSKSTLQGATNLGRSPSFKNVDQARRGAQEQNVNSAHGANLGHQALFREGGSGPDAPGAGGLPNVGSGERSARSQARQRAIASAQRRFGIGDTVDTSPLGVQGQGAALGKKRLTGE